MLSLNGIQRMNTAIESAKLRKRARAMNKAQEIVDELHREQPARDKRNRAVLEAANRYLQDNDQ